MVNPVIVSLGVDLLKEGFDRIRARRAQRNQPLDAPLTDAELRELEQARQAGVAADPQAENANNEEGLPRSRTFMGGLLALITSATGLYAVLKSPTGIDWEIAGPLIGTTIGSFVVVIGRAKEGLVAIDWRRPWSVFGIGKAATGG